MIREFSAGGIVYKKVTSHNSQPTTHNLLWLVSQHSQHKGWVFPKGLIGDNIKGEKSGETAVREVKEETGAEGKIIVKLKNPATYWYVFGGEKHFKTVYYFLMEYVSGDIRKHDHEMSDVEWLTEEEVKMRLTYKSDKIAFKEALSVFNRLRRVKRDCNV